MTQILMPKATAVWLIDNTALTFKQISAFCGLHILEVEGIADGDVASGIRGADPIANGQLDREEIERGEKDPAFQLKANVFENVSLANRTGRKKGPRYTPLSRRQDRPDAIAWLVRNHPEIPDSQISKLIGTTKPTITAIRERTHWKMSTINPTDPVSLGLCTQIDLDAIVKKAADKKALADAKLEKKDGPSLKPVDETVEPAQPAPKAEPTLESLFKPSSD
ncbi:MAG: DUF1013 domain-containing protein [Hellea sp.]|nr:DUF1013 domain-containing protein [Hellea sp.]